MLSYLDIGEYGCVGMYFGIVAYLDIRVDEGIGAYFHMLAEFGERAYAGKRMNVCHNLKSISERPWPHSC